MILARNCPHNNGIYTLIDHAQGVVIKSTYSADGITRLKREYAGYQWYLRQKGSFDRTPLPVIKSDNGLYCRLYINLFPGRPGECYKSLSYNQRDLVKAIGFYAKVWPRQKGRLAPLHGDFSLGNMIIREAELQIIDWEHFQQYGAPWGFDLANLLYESAFFSFRGKNTLSRIDKKVFIETRKAICTLLDPEEDFNCTVENLTQFISTSLPVWGVLVSKLPVMKFTIAQREYLMQLEH